MYVVCDANLIIASTLTPKGVAGTILKEWRVGTFDLLVSTPILAEFRRALSYPRVRRRHKLTEAQLDDLVEELRQFGLLVSPSQPASASPDPKDNMYLACAEAGEANYIVSRDGRHLLSLNEYAGIPILKPKAFLALLTKLKGGELQ